MMNEEQKQEAELEKDKEPQFEFFKQLNPFYSKTNIKKFSSHMFVKTVAVILLCSGFVFGLSSLGVKPPSKAEYIELAQEYNAQRNKVETPVKSTNSRDTDIPVAIQK